MIDTRPPRTHVLRNTPDLFEAYRLHQPPPALYHYGGAKSLLGLVEKKVVWAGNCHYMNDTKEFNYAISILEGLVSTRRTHIASRKRTTAKSDLVFLDALVDRIKKLSLYSLYLYCLTERGDLLSQWRGYTPKGGYSVGFRSHDLREITKDQGFGLYPCIYNKVHQERIISKILTEACRGYSNDVKKEPQREAEKINQYVEEFRKNFIDRAALIKHSGFSEEKEWRLVGYNLPSDPTNLKVREGYPTLVPYYELGMVPPGSPLGTPLPLHEIVIGPTSHPDLAQKSLELLLKLNNVFCNKRHSEVPYRTW